MIRRILAVFVSWIVLVVAAFAGYLALRIFRETRSAGSGGIGAVSVGINGWLMIAILLGPPLALTVLWILKRRLADG